jgi:hypothetical protein
MFQFTGKNTILKKYDDKPENGMMEKSDEIMGKVSDWAKSKIEPAKKMASLEETMLLSKKLVEKDDV